MFELDEQEQERFHEWNSKHMKECPLLKTPDGLGAIGGRLTYCFTGTSLGMIVKVQCGCGEECDLTDYSHW